MEILYSKENLAYLIETYFYERERRKVTVSIETKSQLTGLYENCLTCITLISIKEQIEILGIKKFVKTFLNKDEVSKILNELLENEGYFIDNIEYEDGVESVYTGYGLCERKEKKPYFNGVKLNISKNILAKRK